jgi:hypothetical protein
MKKLSVAPSRTPLRATLPHLAVRVLAALHGAPSCDGPLPRDCRGALGAPPVPWARGGRQRGRGEKGRWDFLYLTFRTLCWNSEAILAELLKRGEAELATDAFTSHNYLFLHTMPLNHNFLQIGRPISDPLGQASGIQLSHRPSGQ